MNECELCYQAIPANRRLCDACSNDMLAAQRKVEDAERVFHERQARACTTE
jgi:predicted nucleic acid-binding Zn ribbon protein